MAARSASASSTQDRNGNAERTSLCSRIAGFSHSQASSPTMTPPQRGSRVVNSRTTAMTYARIPRSVNQFPENESVPTT